MLTVTHHLAPRVNLINTVRLPLLDNYITYMAERGFPLSKQQVKQLAKEVACKSSTDKMQSQPTKKWMRNIFRRHKELALRKPHPLDKSRASLTQEQINNYFSLLKSTLKTLNITYPSQIYNVDETGFSGHLGCAEKVIVKKGDRQAFKVEIALGEHITVNMAISASGATIPPQLIFSKTLPRRASFADGMPYN